MKCLLEETFQVQASRLRDKGCHMTGSWHVNSRDHREEDLLVVTRPVDCSAL